METNIKNLKEGQKFKPTWPAVNAPINTVVGQIEVNGVPYMECINSKNKKYLIGINTTVIIVQ